MKRIVSLLAAALLLISLAACGADSGSETPGISGGTSDSGTQKPAKVTVEPAVVLDEQGVKIQVKELDAGSLFGTELKVLIENNTDKDLTVQCRNTSVNGYMVETMFSADVAAGKKANEAITFMSSDLERSGVETIADMEFSFHIFTTEDWDTYLDSQPVQIKTSAADSYSYTYDHPGTQVYSGNGVEIVAKSLENDSLLGPELVLYIRNDSDKAVMLQTRDASVNGFMVETIFSEEIMPGKHAVAGVTFMEAALEENDISQIQDLEMIFVVMEADSWNTIDETDVVKLSFNK